MIVIAIIFAIFVASLLAKDLRDLKRLGKEHKRRSAILDYRDDLLTTMRENNSSNFQVLHSSVNSPLFPVLLADTQNKLDKMFEVWKSIIFKDIVDSGKSSSDSMGCHS